MSEELHVKETSAVGTYSHFQNEMLTVAHLIKYNFYFQGKTQVFAAILPTVGGDVEKALQLTEGVCEALRTHDNPPKKS